MFFSKVLQSAIKDTVRKVQILLFQRAREVQQSVPYGIDSVPVKDMVAVYSATGEMGQSVIIGYLYKDAVAEVGSIRLYSENGYVHLRANGNLELLGTADNAMRYAAFNSVIQSYLTSQNAAILAGFTALGGSYTPPTAPNFTSAKINEIKTL